MTYHKVGDRILSAEEFEEDSIQKWGLALFIIAALLAGCAMNSILPDEWPKYIRFSVVILVGSLAGTVAAYFVRPIRHVAIWAIFTAVLGGIGYGIWALI